MKKNDKDENDKAFWLQLSSFDSWLDNLTINRLWYTVSRLTNVSKVFGADLFDLVEAGIQVGCLFRQGGNSGHVWTDLLTVHWTSQTHTQQACGQVCNTESSNKQEAIFRTIFYSLVCIHFNGEMLQEGLKALTDCYSHSSALLTTNHWTNSVRFRLGLTMKVFKCLVVSDQLIKTQWYAIHHKT